MLRLFLALNRAGGQRLTDFQVCQMGEHQVDLTGVVKGHRMDFLCHLHMNYQVAGYPESHSVAQEECRPQCWAWKSKGPVEGGLFVLKTDGF